MVEKSSKLSDCFFLDVPIDCGRFDFKLKEYCEARRISRYQLLKAAELQFAQLKNYYENKIVRPDLTVLARICFALGCQLSDILLYVPPGS